MMTFVLSACLTDTSIPEQITSLNVDCKTEEVTCSYLAESDMGCYELND